jgi:predicted transposase YdaD
MTIEREEGRKEGEANGKEIGKEIGLITSLQIIEELKNNKLTPEEIAARFNIKLDLILKLKGLL